ncbi:unnamed protein product, partial [Brenthis ino]
MLARRYLAWILAVEADQDEQRQELVKRRKLNVPSRISDTHFVQRYQLTKEGFMFLCETLRENTNLRGSQRISLETKPIPATAANLNEISQLRRRYYSAQVYAQTQVHSLFLSLSYSGGTTTRHDR